MKSDPEDGTEMIHDEDLEVILTHTAKSKCFRYLRDYEIRQYVHNPPDPIYYNADRKTYLLKTSRRKHSPKLNHEQKETIVIVVAFPEDQPGKAIVVTQTGDHYDWSDYEKVAELGVRKSSSKSQ